MDRLVRHRGQSRMPMPPGIIVVGGQWGSEGKGSFIYEVATDYELHVRVGGPQAGHSAKLPDGQVLKLQTIPVGAASGQRALIGMQSVLDPEVLERELGWFDQLGIDLDLIIDPRATILTPEHRATESGEQLTHKLGSTGKGVGAARADRIMRGASTVGEWVLTHSPAWVDRVMILDTTQEIRQALDAEAGVLVEAAQGLLLSLFSSGYYPYVTSSEATPVQAFADLGLPLRYAPSFESVGVFRTYPIRVAGNSGPLPNEITWEEVEARRGLPIDEDEKTTTVTRKLRRVADWNPDLARQAVRQYGIDWAVLSFLDYVYPEVTGETVWRKLPRGAKQYVSYRESELGVPIKVVGTGFGTYAWRDR